MMTFRDLSIRRKLALVSLTASIFAVILAGLGFAIYQRQAFRTDTVSELTALTDILGANSAASLAFNDQTTAKEILGALSAEQNVLAGLLYDNNGNVFAEYRRRDLSSSFTVPARLGNDAQFDQESVTLFHDVYLKKEKTGSIALVSDLSGSRARFWQYTKIALLVLLISIVAAYLISARLLRIVSDPIVHLAQIAGRVTREENYSLRAIAHGHDESGMLVNSFNQMLERIEQRDSALLTAKGELEERVQQRTADLQIEVAERIRAEQAMRIAKDTAEVANHAKSEFLANMSHEIRTPLNGVIGMTDLALETELTAAQRDCLDTVKMSADSLLTVINDILDYSKIEAGKVELEAINFNLRDAVEDVLKTLALRADQGGLELLCEIASDVPEMVMGDPGRLRQILVNLLSNAIKFTHHGEVALRLDVESQAHDGHAEAKLGMVRFTVADTGIGISAEKQTAIFSPFTQADTSTTRKYGGTGLGLTISARLVALMGGKIWVESTPGQGSQFHFTARLQFLEKMQAQGLVAPVKALNGLKVLVVDDNSTNRRILQGMLSTWGARITCVAGAGEALAELLAAHAAGDRYALILTDLHMPEMDGFQLVEQVRQNPELSPTTVIMLTSAGHPGDVEQCRTLGILSYLYKPVRKRELLAALLSALGPRPGSAPAHLVEQTVQTTQRHLRILLAEDNRVNQIVSTHMLEKMGHTVVIAENGVVALALLATERFDLALMDVQMPEMDGLTATRRIRESEQSTQRHLPIIAMTAHAMKGDRERCLEAGMDGYVTKPVNRQHLEEAIAVNVPLGVEVRSKDHERITAAVAITEDAVIWDMEQTREKLGGDETLFQEVLGIFLSEVPKHMAGLQQAIGQRNARAVEELAHTLKGELGYLGIAQMTQLIREIEELGRTSDLGRAAALHSDLDAGVSVVLTMMRKVVGPSTQLVAGASGASE